MISSSRLSTVFVLIGFLTTAFLNAAPVEILTPELRGAVQPQIAVTPSGRIHVVFGKDNSIYHATSLDGRAFSAPVKVGELEKLALKMRRGPRVTATEKQIVVTAISHADGNLHAWSSGDNGQTWKETPTLNTSTKSAREGLHALAGDGAGFITVVWLDLRGKGAEVWSRVSRDGGTTWAGEVMVYRSPDGHVCECCIPSVALSSKGEIAVMWRNWLKGARDMYLAESRDGGRTFTAARKLGTASWALNACPMDGGGLAFNGSETTAVWRREGAVYLTGKANTETRLAEKGAQALVVATTTGPVTLWEQDGGLTLQRGSQPPTTWTSNARAATIAAMADGRIAVAWEGAGGKGIWFDFIPTGAR